MKLEYQVCSLELAKRLKELDVSPLLGFINPLSIFCWWHSRKTGEWVVEFSGIIERDAQTYSDTDERWAPAFTVAELGEMLPICYASVLRGNGMNINGIVLKSFEMFKSNIEKMEKDGTIGKSSVVGFESEWIMEETEADCRASLLISLIEQGLVKPI